MQERTSQAPGDSVKSSISVEGLSLSLGDRRILEEISFEVGPGEIVSIIGGSGCGKSTLLHAIAGFIPVEGGKASIGKLTITGMDEGELAEARRSAFSLMTQDFHLLKRLPALQNVAISSLLGGTDRTKALELARSALERLGLGEHLNKPPANLSRGQRQRVAFARAIVDHRPVLLLDEPSSSLDRSNTEELLAVMREVADSGVAVLAVTHDDSLLAITDRAFELSDGRLSPIGVASGGEE